MDDARRWVMQIETMPGERAAAATRVRLELGRMVYLMESSATYDAERRVIVARFTLEAPTMRIAARVGYAAFTRALKRAGLEPLAGDTSCLVAA
jgi:hypothetical protein